MFWNADDSRLSPINLIDQEKITHISGEDQEKIQQISTPIAPTHTTDLDPFGIEKILVNSNGEEGGARRGSAVSNRSQSQSHHQREMDRESAFERKIASLRRGEDLEVVDPMDGGAMASLRRAGTRIASVTADSDSDGDDFEEAAGAAAEKCPDRSLIKAMLWSVKKELSIAIPCYAIRCKPSDLSLA